MFHKCCVKAAPLDADHIPEQGRTAHKEQAAACKPRNLLSSWMQPDLHNTPQYNINGA